MGRQKAAACENSDLWEQLIDARKRLEMFEISLLLVHAEEHSEKLIEATVPFSDESSFLNALVVIL